MIDNLNPTVWLELHALRDMCGDFGVQRLNSKEQQIALYQRMIALAPSERVPRHRLVSVLLRTGQVDTASQAIRDAEENIGRDPVLSR